MISSLSPETQRLMASYLDCVQVYRLHHVSRDVCSLLHVPLRNQERNWREDENGRMRMSEPERATYEGWRLSGRTHPPSPDESGSFDYSGGIYSDFSDFS